MLLDSILSFALSLSSPIGMASWVTHGVVTQADDDEAMDIRIMRGYDEENGEEEEDSKRRRTLIMRLEEVFVAVSLVFVRLHQDKDSLGLGRHLRRYCARR